MGHWRPRRVNEGFSISAILPEGRPFSATRIERVIERVDLWQRKRHAKQNHSWLNSIVLSCNRCEVDHPSRVVLSFFSKRSTVLWCAQFHSPFQLSRAARPVEASDT